MNVRGFWSQRVEKYRQRKSAYDTQVLEVLLDRAIRSYQPVRILEVGCGPGIFALELSKKAETVSIDVSNRMLRSIKSHGIDVDLVQADMDDLPFREETFDMVVAYRVLEYSKRDVETLQRFSRLAPVILLQLPRLDSFNALRLFFLRWAAMILRRGVKFKVYSLKGAQRLARSVKLIPVETVVYNNGLDIHITLLRNR